jgi:hypothetical protein
VTKGISSKAANSVTESMLFANSGQVAGKEIATILTPMGAAANQPRRSRKRRSWIGDGGWGLGGFWSDDIIGEGYDFSQFSPGRQALQRANLMPI